MAIKENSIEEDITRVKQRIEDVKEYIEYGLPYSEYLDLENSFDNILSDYKRVLEENEELNSKIPNLEQGTEILMEINIKLTNELNDSISKQKIKDIIDRIDYDIKKTKEIISNNSNIYTSNRRNDYQIVRLRAMNTKSLDIKKRLQKLLESEE